MGRKARLRMLRKRQTLPKKQNRQIEPSPDQQKKPLAFMMHGYKFLAEWIIGSSKEADEIRKIYKARLENIQDTDLVMPYEIVGYGQGLAFIHDDLKSIETCLDPNNPNDTALENFYHSQSFSDAILEIAEKLIMNGRLVSDLPMMISLPK
jgi:hypothetical protein